ncbi:MAG: hypothetical protein IT184_16000 [Acidobacteria bacterium]|nr:hypothetical protein [Acidobacteriota bacterium]
MRAMLGVVFAIAMAGVLASRPEAAPAAETVPQAITVVGCVERDAASRADIYKLVVKANGGSRIYRLSAGGNVDIPGALGRTVEVTGTVGANDVLTVQKMRTVSERCS